MKKIYFTFIFSIFMLIANSIFAQTTITIDLNALGGSSNIGSTNYANGVQRISSINGVEIGSKALTAANSSNTGAIQCQASNGVLYNIDPLPGKIISVVVTSWGTINNPSTLTVGEVSTGVLVNSTTGNYTVASSTGTTNLGSSTPGNWTTISGDNRYFAIKRGTGTAYWQKVEITYETVPTCTAPTNQVSALTHNNVSSTTSNFSWATGNGDATLLALRATAQANALPVSGTAYVSNTDFSATSGINANNKVVYSAASNTINNISNLTPGTQYTATAYAFNTIDNCYNTSTPATVTFFTLSTAPAAQPANFTATASSFDQINLTFSAANSISNAAGYLILQRENAAPTGLPTNANAYNLGNIIGDATVAAIVTDVNAVSQSIANLSAQTNYYYAIIPFNRNSNADATTYNYLSNNVIFANATTMTGPSSTSDIIDIADATFYTSNLDYLQYQATTINTFGVGSLSVMKLQLRDGGATNTDADALPTQLKDLTINYTGTANTIRKAALFDGSTKIAEVTALPNSIVFTNISGLQALDNSSKNFNLVVSFNPTVVDNEKLIFTVTNATTLANTVSSQFATTNAGGASSDVNANDNNRIEVVASQLNFKTNATNTNINTAMYPSPIVSAVDINNNVDLDATGTINLTSSGTLNASPLTGNLSNGQASFSNIIHTALGTGLNLTAQMGTYTVNSATFKIQEIPFANGDYRTTSNGSWNGGATQATWEVLNNGTWTATAAPSANVTGKLYIQHLVTASGSFASPNIVVLDGGKFTGSSSASTIASMYVYSGGIFEIVGTNTTISTSATAKNFIIESGGKLIINAALTSTSIGSSVWGGNEDFQNGSIVEILNWNFSGSNGAQRLIYSTPQISQNANGYLFGNLIYKGSNSSLFGFVHGSPIVKLAENDLVIDAPGATNNIVFTISGASVEIGGNLNVINGSFGAAASPASNSHTINGNLYIASGSVLTLNQQNASANTTINLLGNLTSNGTIKGTNPNTTYNNYIVFKKNGLQTIAINTLNDYVYFQVENGSELLLSQDLSLSNSRNVLEVLNGGTLNFNGYNVTGGGSLINNTNGSLKITSADGIVTAGALGNVRTVTRIFNIAGNYIYESTSAQVTGNALPASVSKLVINNNANVTLSQATTINTELNLINGNLITSTTALPTLTSVTNILNTNNNFINGTVAFNSNSTNNKVIPVGKNNVLASITITPDNTIPTTYLIQYYNGSNVSPNSTSFATNSEIDFIDANQYWEVSRTAGTSNATLGFATTGLTNTNLAIVAHYNGSNWENLNGTFANGIITSSLVSNFSPFTIGQKTSTPLPLGFNQFELKYQSNIVNLKWKNPSELQNSIYTIERSKNGFDFEAIGTVAAQGNDYNYSFNDNKYNYGVNFYRIKVAEIDGYVAYTTAQKIIIENNPSSSIEIYPNPTKDVIILKGLATNETITIYNSLGQKVKTLKANQFEQTIDVNDFKSGVYFVEIVHLNNTKTMKQLLIKQ